MKDKYNMTQKDNILMAKRVLVDAIYKSANLEGIAVTYAETNDILNDVNVENIKPSEMNKVFCLRDAWRYILDNIDKEIHLGFIEEIHTLITKSELEYQDLGKIRTTGVLISGTSWRPEIPDAELLHNELQELLKIENVTDRALSIMLWIMRSQIFKDGNKRVATLICNKILIEYGKGIFSVPVELDGKFKTMLVNYYETNNIEQLKNWCYENCIEGI